MRIVMPLFDFYNESVYSGSWAFDNNKYACQAFTPSQDFTAESCKIRQTLFFPNTDVTMRIYAADGSSKPTGSILATSGPQLEVSGWQEFVFDTPVLLSSGVEYCLWYFKVFDFGRESRRFRV